MGGAIQVVAASGIADHITIINLTRKARAFSNMK